MLTLSTCFYKVKNKYDINTYENWMVHFLKNIKKFNLVIYTNNESLPLVKKYAGPRIRIIIKEFNKFYNYKYKDYWIKNNKDNKLLKHIDWQLQMIWAEKINFVKNTIEKKIFDSEWYGWCDIGYFRNNFNISNWPDESKISSLNVNKIYYGQVCTDEYLDSLNYLVQCKDEYELPIPTIPNNQESIAGGFFLITHHKIDYWFNTFDDKLLSYFKNDYLVKDDQMIIINCILLNRDIFHLAKNHPSISSEDDWFIFKHFLLNRKYPPSKPLVPRPQVHKPRVRKPQVPRPQVHKPLVRKPQIPRPQVHKPRVHKPQVRKSIIQKPVVLRPVIINNSSTQKQVQNLEVHGPQVQKPLIVDNANKENKKNTEQNGDKSNVSFLGDYNTPIVHKDTVGKIITNKISILMIVHDISIKYLEQCFNSIASQTYQGRVEIIIINDCSDDDKMNDYLKKIFINHRFNITVKFNKSEMGFGKSMNIGVNLCSNELIYIMNPLNIMFQDKIQKQYIYFKKKSDTDILGTGVQKFSDGGNINEINNSFKREILSDLVLKNNLDNFISLDSIVLKRSVIESLNGFSETSNKNVSFYDFLLRALSIDKKVRVLGEIHLLQRVKSIKNEDSDKTVKKLLRDKLKQYISQ